MKSDNNTYVSIDLLKAWESGLKENSKNPLVKQKLKEKDKNLFYQFEEQYKKLSLLSRKVRRAMQKKWKHSLAGIALVLALGGAPAIAAEINVDADCTLIEAINSANDDNAMGNGCEDGSGTDTINLPPNSTQTLTAVDNSTYGPAGLPLITTTITIEGNGSTIERDGAAPPFKIFSVGTVADLTINETTITGGLADTDVDGSCPSAAAEGTRGGAILCCACDLTITNSVITNNNASNDGGGIYSNGATDINIINSTISNNNTDIQIFSTGDDGGGIYTNGDGTINIENSTISGNFSGEGGGIYLGGDTTTNISNSTISGNTAIDNFENDYFSEGGGIYNEGTLTISNSTISGNMSLGANAEGGGLQNSSGATSTLINVTIFGNEAGDEGGGIYNAGVVNLSNTIVSGNTATVGAEIYDDEGTVNANSYNLFGHSGLTDAQAFFGFSPTVPTDINATSDGTIITLANIINTTLADNGGPTQTHALPPQSVAVDGGENATCAASPVDDEDQRFFPRPVDGDGMNAAECDIGAYEFQGTGTISVTKMSDPSATGFGFTSANFPDGCELQSPFTLDDGETKSCIVPLNPDDDTDDYSVTEDDPSGEGFISTVIDCTETGSATSTDDTNNPSVDLGIVADGDTIDCIFTNEGDNDSDGIANGEDNCPDDPNIDQADFDMDGMGDVCDTDDDNDGVDDGSDSDPMNQQVCSDTDGDTCDDCTNTTDSANQGGNTADDGADGDGDGICDAGDNCPADANMDQANSDGDSLGDVCDNCPDDTNEDQADTDGDDIGDVCDEDEGDDDDDDDDSGDGDGDGDGDDDIEIGNDGTTNDGIRVDIIVDTSIPGGGTILVDLPPQVKPLSANLIPNVGNCVIVDPDSDTNVVDVDIVCDVNDFPSEFDLDLELCLEGGDDDAEGIAIAEIEVIADNSSEEFSEFIPILLTALEGCGDGGGGCSVAPVNTTKTSALSNFFVTLIPAIVGFGAMFFRRRKNDASFD